MRGEISFIDARLPSTRVRIEESRMKLCSSLGGIYCSCGGVFKISVGSFDLGQSRIRLCIQGLALVLFRQEASASAEAWQADVEL